MRFVIPIAPVTKKNHQQVCINRSTGRPFVMPSKQYIAYEQQAILYVPKGIYINYPVNVRCLFYMKTRRKCDLTNLLECIDDVMVKSGLLSDDNCTIIASHDGSRVLFDKENPRTEIEIEKVEVEE